MHKSKWMLHKLIHRGNVEKSHASQLLSLIGTKYIKAKQYVDKVETRFAKPLLEEILSFDNHLKKEDMPQEIIDIFAESKYLLAFITFKTSTSIDDSYKAYLLLQEALKLKPKLQKAIELKESLEIEHDYFSHNESNVHNKQ